MYIYVYINNSNPPENEFLYPMSSTNTDNT